MNLRLYFPIKPYVKTQNFGECHPSVCSIYQQQLGLQGHNGEDSQAAIGTIVRAAHDGVVTFAGEDGSAGYGVVIRTDKPYTYKGGDSYFKSIYWHLHPNGIKVKAGQRVFTGDIIALSGNSGLSSGPHLHFGLKPVYQGEADWQWFNAEQNNGFKGAVNPAPFWTGIYAQDYGPQVTLYQRLILAYKAILEELTKPH